MKAEMITDHVFVGLRQWGISPPQTAPCQVDGCGMPLSQHVRLCPGVLSVAGESYKCDLVYPHDGWSHSNKAAQARWSDDSLAGIPQ